MKEGFERYDNNNQIVRKDLSEKEKEYWKNFEPDSNTPRDPSQEEIISDSLDHHEDIFGTKHTPTKILTEENLIEKYKVDIENRADTLYTLSDELQSLVLLAQEHEDLRPFPSIITTLETAAAFISLVQEHSEQLSSEQLQNLNLPTKRDQLESLIEKIKQNIPFTENDIALLEDTAKDLNNLGLQIESALYQEEGKN